jgi:Amt family ammonium transporter
MNKCRVLWVVAISAILSFAATGTVLAAESTPAQPSGEDILWPLVAGSLAWLVPIGFVLIAAAGMETPLARQAALTGLVAMGLSTLGYWAIGFGVHFGGIGLLSDRPGLEGLVWEWSALGPDWGPGWGMAGLRGWGLLHEAATPAAYALFFAQLPWVTTATLIPLLNLRGRTPTLVTAITGLLVSTLLYPLIGNWISGGGWLANLGHNLGLGHGLVDFGGAANVHLLGASVALAGILIFCPRRPSHTDEGPVDLPPVHLPLLGTLGAILIVVGGLGWNYANPLLDLAVMPPIRGAINVLLAAAGGALAPLAYTWFVIGQHDALVVARGATTGTIAVLAAGPLVPPWAALLIGTIAGVAVPLATYTVDHILRLNDPTAVMATHGLGGIWGLLSVALFADGLAGRGWNGIGPDQYLGVVGQGVTGLFAAVHMQPDWPGQMQAQIIGLLAIVLIPFLATSLALGVIATLLQAWHAPRFPRD